MRERWGMLRHLMAKDWRYVRAGAIRSWALVAAAWAVIDLDPDLWFLTALVHVLALLAPFLVFGRLLQLDPVLGDTSFWLTRPIDRRLQLASKMAVGFGAVLGPCLLLSVLPLGFRGLDLTPRDYALAVGSMMVRYLFIAWVMLVVGGVARSLAETFLLATAFVGMIVLGTKVYERVWIPADFVHEPSLTVGLAVLLPLQALLSLYVLYRWRRLGPAAVAFVLAGMAIIAVGREWRWNLMAPLMAKTLGKSAGTRIDWPIRAQILAEHGLRSSEEVGGSGRALLVRFEGIPDGVSLVHTAYETTATLWNGRRCHRSSRPIGGWKTIPSGTGYRRRSRRGWDVRGDPRRRRSSTMCRFRGLASVPNPSHGSKADSVSSWCGRPYPSAPRFSVGACVFPAAASSPAVPATARPSCCGRRGWLPARFRGHTTRRRRSSSIPSAAIAWCWKCPRCIAVEARTCRSLPPRAAIPTGRGGASSGRWHEVPFRNPPRWSSSSARCSALSSCRSRTSSPRGRRRPRSAPRSSGRATRCGRKWQSDLNVQAKHLDAKGCAQWPLQHETLLPQFETPRRHLRHCR